MMKVNAIYFIHMLSECINLIWSNDISSIIKLKPTQICPAKEISSPLLRFQPKSVELFQNNNVIAVTTELSR